MSAILGIYYLNGKRVKDADLECMSRALAHRGADATGTWNGGVTGLGHRMLWTTPESLNERLPLKSRTGHLVVTADARLDNRDDLIDRLQPDSGNQVSDSELILAAYEKWGEECPEKLIGDFVLVIWDTHKNALFCARDPLGVKHFYYYYRPHELFVFASEIKALFCVAAVPRTLNELGVADHLLPTYDDKISTLYDGIVRLPANHQLTVGSLGLRVKRCWTPDLSRELRLKTDHDYAEAFKDIFTESVRCRLRSAFPVGSMLSGGLDSSSITCVAGKLLTAQGKEPLHTFSAIWPSIAVSYPKIDERRYMKAVTDLGGFNAHYVYADRISPLVDWKKIFWHQDNCVSAPNMYMDWAIFKEAKEQGVRVLLGGTDGDTTVSYGYEDLAAFVRRGHWVKLAREVHALKRNMPRGARAFRKLIWNSAFGPFVPSCLAKAWHYLRGTSQPRDNELSGYCKSRPINNDFARRLKLGERFVELKHGGESATRASEWHWSGISSGMWSYILESFEKAGGAQSVDLRYPFFDRRLIQFCLSLPPGQRLNGGWTRSILRRAMTGILPHEVQWRTTKGNLSAGVNLKLKEYEKDTLDDVIVRSPWAIQDFVDIPQTRAVYQRYLKNPFHCSDDAFTLMLVTNLSLWLRTSGFRYRSNH